MEETPERRFQAIAARLAAESQDIVTAKMMSSPGIRYKEKVFAFFHQGGMVFKLGREFDPAALGLHDYRLLSPYKTKPPLRDWFEIPVTHIERWEELARLALLRMREQQF